MMKSWIRRISTNATIRSARQLRRRSACTTRPRVESLEHRALPSFLPAVSYPVGAQATSVAVGDFNGDGVSDMAVTDLTSNSLSVFLGNSDGTVQSPVTYSVSQSPRWVTVGDFNGDGILDLAVVDHNGVAQPGLVSILLGNGDGTFQPATNFAVGNGPSSAAVGDFNNDGIADLAVANYSDGTVSVLLGNGDGTFQNASSFTSGSTPAAIAVADFNGDGHADIVVANRLRNTVSVLLGNGDATFQAPSATAGGNQAFNVAVGDFNGDGVADLAVADRTGQTVDILLGNGDGTFQTGVTYPAGSGPWSVATADFNGDGIADLAVADNGGGVSVLLGNGDGTFQDALNYGAGTAPFAVAAGDFNRDGFPDLAVANRFSNDVSVLINDANWGGGSPRPGPGRNPSLNELGQSLEHVIVNSAPVRPSGVVADVHGLASNQAIDGEAGSGESTVSISVVSSSTPAFAWLPRPMVADNGVDILDMASPLDSL